MFKSSELEFYFNFKTVNQWLCGYAIIAYYFQGEDPKFLTLRDDAYRVFFYRGIENQLKVWRS